MEIHDELISPDRERSIELAKRLLVDSIWKTANIEVDGITFPDTQEIFEGRAPSSMRVDDIITVNNIKHAWQFLIDNVDYPVDWQYVKQYNQIVGEGLIRESGMLRNYGVRIGGTQWVPQIPTLETSQGTVAEIMTWEEPLDRALELFGAITRGQWFSDGNKRTALMAANHELIYAGMGILSIQPSDKTEFTSRLLSYYESGDFTQLKQWLTANAFGKVPGGMTDTQQRRLEAEAAERAAHVESDARTNRTTRARRHHAR